MEQEITLKLNLKQIEVVMQGLMELQGKLMLPVMQSIDAQVRSQIEVPSGSV